MGFYDPKQLILQPYRNADPEIGRWLWALDDARWRTLERLEGISAEAVDWAPPDGGSSIGTVLYHIALIEADWLYAEVLEQEYAPAIAELFPWEVRDEQRLLTQVHGIGIEVHLQRLQTVRTALLDVFGTMELDDFRRARHLPDYDVTPQWVLHHLMQHEAEHRSQIGALRARAEQALL
jgi:uncharacterized damage-inducible protein DinB